VAGGATIIDRICVVINGLADLGLELMNLKKSKASRLDCYRHLRNQAHPIQRGSKFVIMAMRENVTHLCLQIILDKSITRYFSHVPLVIISI